MTKDHIKYKSITGKCPICDPVSEIEVDKQYKRSRAADVAMRVVSSVAFLFPTVWSDNKRRDEYECKKCSANWKMIYKDGNLVDVQLKEEKTSHIIVCK